MIFLFLFFFLFSFEEEENEKNVEEEFLHSKKAISIYIYFLRKKNSEIFSKFNLVERNIIEFEVLNIILRIVYIRE